MKTIVAVILAMSVSAGCASVTSGSDAAMPPRVVANGETSVIHNAGGGEPSVVKVQPMSVPGEQKITVHVENTPAVPSAAPIRCVLVVQNHCLPTAGVPMASLADILTAKLTGTRFQVVNPSNVVGVNQNRTVVGEPMPTASANDLARQLGAPTLLTASVLEFAKEGIGVPAVAYKLKARLSMTLADCASGASICGATVNVESPQYTAGRVSQDGATLYTEVLYSAANACSDELERRMASVAWPPTSAPGAQSAVSTVYFGCNVLGADVQIDGVSYGTCPAQISVAPGIHNLTVSYPPYYLPFNRRAMFTGNGQTFAIVLQTTPEGEKVRRSGILFDRQKELFDAEMSRYKASGEVEDYVRKTIADGTSIYWKNSYGRIVITDGSAENISFTTPATDAADLQDAPTTGQIGKKLKELLEEPQTAK